MTATVLTVTITQLVASHNLKKTLAENRETARESQQENKEALDRTLEANENNLNRTLASSKETLERTLEADAEKHRAELSEKRLSRTFSERLSVAADVYKMLLLYGQLHEEKEYPEALSPEETIMWNSRFSLCFPKPLRDESRELIKEGFKIAEIVGALKTIARDKVENPQSHLFEYNPSPEILRASYKQEIISYEAKLDTFLANLHKELGIDTSSSIESGK